MINLSMISDTSAPAGNVTEVSAVKYRVLYAFEARNEDELSVMPGDIVLVRRCFLLLFTNAFAYSNFITDFARINLGCVQICSCQKVFLIITLTILTLCSFISS